MNKNSLFYAFIVSITVHLMVLFIYPDIENKANYEKKDREIDIVLREYQIGAEIKSIKKKNVIKENKKKEILKELSVPVKDYNVNSTIKENDVRDDKDDAIIENSDEKLINYQYAVIEKIQKVKVYPSKAREKKIEGKVSIIFTLLRNGKTENIEIVKSSGFSMLDNASKEIIEKASPFPPFPPFIASAKISLSIMLNFYLN